jgi:hypothetical protein
LLFSMFVTQTARSIRAAGLADIQVLMPRAGRVL